MTRDEAIKDIRDNIKPIVGGKSLDMAIEALSIEIVRCKDCQYRDRVFDFGRGGCMNPKGLKRIVYENNYCCHGKRREEDEQIH